MIKQNTFYNGISDDIRAYSPSGFAISKHFDIFTNPNKITPYRSFETDTNDGITVDGMKKYVVKDFLYASNSAKLYGLGKVVATGLTKIFYKDNAISGNWTIPANSEGDGAVLNGCLVEYKNYIWGFQGTTQVFKWGLLSGTPAITNSAGTVGTVYNTVTGVTINAAGTGYSINDVLYITSGNNSCSVIVSAVSGTTVTGVTILEAGYNQTTTTGSATTTTGAGTGCKINITTVANVSTPISSIAQGVVAKDDNLYLAYNNIIVRVYPSGTVQDQVLKLPTNLKITSICNWGNYLAIGCSPLNIYNGSSKVFLWGLTSPDVTEVIDWGEGELRVLESIEGTLIGVTDRYLNNTSGAGRGSMIIQGYSGGNPQVLKEVFTKSLSGLTMPQSKAVKNNRLFFTAKIMTKNDGSEYNEGIWSFGRKNTSYPYALTLDYIDENINTYGIQSFGSAANFFFISHSADGSIDKIDETAVYNFTSILETQIFNFGDPDIDKRLEKVKVSFVKLSAGQSITVKYKIDDDSSWTTIGTYSTVDKKSKTFLNLEGTGAKFRTGKEFQFQISSSGGAEITGFVLEASNLSTI